MNDPQQKSAAAKPQPPEPPPITINLNLNAIVQLNNVPGQSDPQMAQILALLQALTTQGGLIMASLDTLAAQVQANTDVEQSAITLIQGIAAALEAAKTDPTRVQALADQLKASADNLAAAITANTPAA